MPSSSNNDQPTRIFVNDGNSGILVYKKENNRSEPIKPGGRRSNFLDLPFEIRQIVYQHIFLGEEILNTAVVPQHSSQVHVGISRYLPGSDLLATCRKIREEGRVYLFSRVHFTTQYSNNGFTALRRFNWHKNTMALVESVDINTTSLLVDRSASWANDLHLLVVEMPKLKYLRISTAFRGNKTDDILMSPRGEELFLALPLFQAYLLRFGSFITLRHPTLRFLAWSKPTGDTRLINGLNGVVHYAIKLVADSHLLGRKDTILSGTAIRQETLEALTFAHAEDFQHPNRSLDSEGPLEPSHATNQTRRAAHAAASGVEHLAYLTVAERRRLGLPRQLDFDVLILQARTGLLESEYAPVYSAIRIVRASIVQRDSRSISVATGRPLHAVPETPRDAPSQHVAAAPYVRPVGGRGRGRGFKRGDLVEYMLGHTDYLETLDDAFGSADLPRFLEPVKVKKKRGSKTKKEQMYWDHGAGSG